MTTDRGIGRRARDVLRTRRVTALGCIYSFKMTMYLYSTIKYWVSLQCSSAQGRHVFFSAATASGGRRMFDGAQARGRDPRDICIWVANVASNTFSSRLCDVQCTTSHPTDHVDLDNTFSSCWVDAPRPFTTRPWSPSSRPTMGTQRNPHDSHLCHSLSGYTSRDVHISVPLH